MTKSMNEKWRKREEFKSVLERDIEFKGSITSSEEIVVDGTVDGKIDVQNTIYVTRNATVGHTLKAEQCSVQQASVTGRIEITGNLAIHEYSTVRGEIVCGTIDIEKGANIDGTISTSTPTP